VSRPSSPRLISAPTRTSRLSHITQYRAIALTLFYSWQKQFFENGAVALERKNAAPENQHLKTIAALRDKLQRKNEVVSELMEEHIQLKKELGEL
jgi:transposase